MIDRKASIMITVNAIILSLVMGGLIGGSEEFTISLLPTLGLSITSILSIIFAIIAIRPLLTQGDFTENKLETKKEICYTLEISIICILEISNGRFYKCLMIKIIFMDQ